MRPIHPQRKLLEISAFAHILRWGGKKRFHFENITSMMPILDNILKLTGLHKIGERNALDVIIKRTEISLNDLPVELDGISFVLISDLHIDGMPDRLIEKILSELNNISYDYCLLGGDYRFRVRGSPLLAIARMKDLVRELRKRTPVLGILGNHDEYYIADELAKQGAEMLMNEHVQLSKGGKSIYLVGLDDAHYYEAHDFEQAENGIPEDGFKLLLCHSPELYKEAWKRGYRLYMAGHTHGGQICLPWGIAVVQNARVPMAMGNGLWSYKSLQGYTTPGAGSSGIPVRFNCPPEISLLILRRKTPSIQ